MSKTVKVALLQLEATDNKTSNTDKTFQCIREAAENGAQIVCTQELFQTLYFCQNHDEDHFDLAEESDGGLIKKLGELAKELGVVIVSSFFEKEMSGVYFNTASVHDADGSFLGIYRKMHIPEDPGFHEKYYFTPGDEGYKVFKTKYGKVGVLICWDQWFPESARLTALKGADILFYPTAIGVLPNEDETVKREFMDAWETMHKSHAIANGCFVAAINRVGQEGDIRFWGDSFVSAPFGQVIAQAGDEETILYAECDFNLIEKQRRTWPFLRDRRPETYKALTGEKQSG